MGYKLGGFGLTLEVTLMLETTLEASLEERLDKLDLSGSNRIDVQLTPIYVGNARQFRKPAGRTVLCF